MASYDITIDGACKGTPEDVANMKRRLAALLEADEIDLDKLKEIFGEELKEIENDSYSGKELLDILNGETDPDEYDPDYLISGFPQIRYDWDDADPENLQFSGYWDDSYEVEELWNVFLSPINGLFPRVGFHWIIWYYISWGGYVITDGEEELYSWDEGDNGEEKKDAYVDWQLAYRKVWLLPEDAPAEERAVAQKAEADAEADFFVLLAKPQEGEDEEAVDWAEARGITDLPPEDEGFQSRNGWPHGSSMNTFEMSYEGPRTRCGGCSAPLSGRTRTASPPRKSTG